MTPPSVLESFFKSSTSVLNEIRLDRPSSSTEIRGLLLEKQFKCLEQAVNEYNQDKLHDGDSVLQVDAVRQDLSKLQNETIPPSTKRAMDEMNEAARLAFCRLVLYSECLRKKSFSQENRKLKTSDMMPREDVLEFIGLCNTCVRLINVQSHMGKGSPLFADLPEESLPPKSIYPHKRLELLQRLFLQALGYDADHGTAEIKRIFFTANGRQELVSKDIQLLNLFENLVVTMNHATNVATQHATQASLFSDHTMGGVTRVVSINSSEKIINGETGEVESVSSSDNESRGPSTLIMEQQSEEKRRKQLFMAQEAARAQQEMLGELLIMSEDEREMRLEEARAAKDELNRNLATLPTGQERVLFLQSVDLKTQKMLVMEKMWTSILEKNGGVPPRIHKK